MSIRLRLTLWYVAILIVGLTVFSGAVYLHVDASSRAAFDDVLTSRTQALASFIRIKPQVHVGSDAPDEASGQLGTASLWIRVVNDRGLQVPGGSQGAPFAGTPVRLLHTLDPGFHDFGPLRMFVLPVMLSGDEIGAIQAITSTDSLGAENQPLLEAMVIAGIALVALAALGGLFLARVALHPVSHMTSMARQIGASDLSRRVSPVLRRPPMLGAWSRNDELHELAATFDGMLGRLEQADRRRRDLTADAAHELVTPVAGIQSEAEVALRRDRTPEEYRFSLRSVLSEAQHLERIVDELLLLASADSGHLPMAREPVEMDLVCRSAVAALQAAAEALGIRLTTDFSAGALVVAGDETKLGQVVRNLIRNALNHTPTGGEVVLALRPVESMGTEMVEVSVRDSGPGIPIDERERIFERFHRIVPMPVHTNSDSEGMTGRSTGLGLAICKAIVEAHGGEISVEAVEPLGARFVFAIPRVTNEVIMHESRQSVFTRS